MTNLDERLIRYYINKNYYVQDGKFFYKTKEHEWGIDIVYLIHQIFYIPEEEIILVFRDWASNFLNEKEINEAWGVRKLKVTWNPEIAQDLAMYGIDNEDSIVRLLAEEISKEINNDILKKLAEQTPNLGDFKEVMKCVGYQISDAMIYDPNTLSPKRYIHSITHNEMMKARRLNDTYQDFINNLQN
jgi:hypothetical protein